MIDTVDIFSSPIFRKKLSIDNTKILEYCLSLEKKDPGRVVSNLGGWQSSPIFETPNELKELYNLISQFSDEVCKHMELYPVEIFNSWININRYKDSNWPHTHADSVLSGVYYVKTPENCGNIEFENASNETIPVFVQRTGMNRFHSPNWVCPSTEGDLYIFPGWLRHGVNPNYNKLEERVSISFNLIH